MRLLLIIGLLFCSTAQACESFEDCMRPWKEDMKKYCDGNPFCPDDFYLLHPDSGDVQMAIAFKLEEIRRENKNHASKQWMLLNKQIDLLEEISKKLDKEESEETMIKVPNQPEPNKRVAEDVSFSSGQVLNLMTQIVDGSEIVERDGTTAFKGKKYKISRAMGCIYKIEIMDPSDPSWT